MASPAMAPTSPAPAQMYPGYQEYAGGTVPILSSDILGAGVINAANIGAAAPDQAPDPQQIAAEMESIRSTLSHLGPAEKTIIDNYLAFTIRLPDHPGHATYADWLADDKHGATNDQLLWVMKRQAALVTNQRQSEVVQRSIRVQKDELIGAQRQAIADGYYSKHAGTTEQRLSDAKVVIGDVWDTIIKQRLGYHRMGSDTVVIAQGYTVDDDSLFHPTVQLQNDVIFQISETLPHEGDHIQGFGRWEAAWWMEGMAEHNALSSKDGQYHLLRPSLRGEADSGRYAENRELIAALAEDGYEKISARIITCAHTSAGRDSDESRTLLHSLDTAWRTKDMYQKVNLMVVENLLEYKETRPDLSEQDRTRYALKATIEALRAIRKQPARPTV